MEAFSLEPQFGFIGAGVQQMPFAVLSAPKAETWSVENCHGQNTSSFPLALMLVTRSQSKERQAPWPSLRAMAKSRQRTMLAVLSA